MVRAATRTGWGKPSDNVTPHTLGTAWYKLSGKQLTVCMQVLRPELSNGFIIL